MPGEDDSTLLEDRRAIVYGAGGMIGSVVARAFAREGAKVHFAGRTMERLQVVAEEIRQAGGTAEVAHVDALDERARRRARRSWR